MGRSGRNRKIGQRYPSGDIKQPKKEVETLAPAIWGRMRTEGVKIFKRPEFETQLGRLSASERLLSDAQAAAGFRIRDIYRRWHRFKAQRDFAKSPNFEHGFGSADLAEERMSAEQLQAFEGNIRAAESAWRFVDSELALCSARVRQAVIDLCVFDTAINTMLVEEVGQFLDRMVLKWGEDWRRQSRKAPQLSLRAPMMRQITMGVVQARPKPRTDHSASALRAIVHKLRPDLQGDELVRVQEVFVALRDREEFNAKKRPRSP